MCGIAGWVGRFDGEPDAAAALRAMCDAIRHRGPDDDGYHLAPGVALGMRRLSIIDVAGGSQPVANEDATIHVVFNGEIYNYRELRQRLARGRHRLTGHGDTETLPHLYEDDSDRLVHALRGMFAFALWDARRQRLLLARDRLGIKPLYYWRADAGVAFASELRSLLALSCFRPDIDRHAVGQYLAFGHVPDPDSILSGVQKLPPGHVLIYDQPADRVRITQYWSPIQPPLAHIDEQDAAHELRRLLADAVACHLESDVPVGAFLSGGLDSSAVVSFMTRAVSHPVKTFSIGFTEPEYNEAPYAAEVARALGTEHTELIVRPDADALVEDVIESFDEPFGDSSALPTYLVARLASDHVKVVLSGDGGDELFGGYTRYGEILNRREVRPAALRAILRRVARLLPHATPGRNRLLDLARTRWGRYAATVALAPASDDGGVLLPDIATNVGMLDALLDRWTRQTTDRDFLTRMMLVDVQSYLPGDILTKVDRMSMANSLEARVPLLDHHVVEFALALPAHLTRRDHVGKWLFRRAIAHVVPPAVLTRRKQGFALPLCRWLRQDIAHRVRALLRPDSPIYEFVDRAAVQRVAAEHQRSRRDHSHLLWRLLALDVWLSALTRGELGRSSPQRSVAYVGLSTTA
jgi:asparagine synthase (glutamine-hydrolysing)